jgi:hypothetical protein
MADLRKPFRPHVLEAGGIDQTEAEQEAVCLGVTEWSEAVVVLLAGRVPQTLTTKQL